MGDLILSQANESHEGSYLCQAKNGIGSSGKSKLITIKVDGKDIILTYTYKTNLLNKEKQNTNTQLTEIFEKSAIWKYCKARINHIKLFGAVRLR